MKEEEWLTQDKMLFESGHAGFDEQTTYIGPGIVSTATQYSNLIHPFARVEWNDMSWPLGELQERSLQVFKGRGIPDQVLYEVKEKTKHQEGYLYLFFHRTKRTPAALYNDGLILTNTKTHACRGVWPLADNRTSHRVLGEACKYITSDFDDEDEEVLYQQSQKGAKAS